MATTMFHVTWAAHELIIRHGIDWRQSRTGLFSAGRDAFYEEHDLPRGNYLADSLELAEKFCRDGWGNRNIYRVDVSGLHLARDPYFVRFPEKAVNWRGPSGAIGSFFTADTIPVERISPVRIFRVYVDKDKQAAIQQLARERLAPAA